MGAEQDELVARGEVGPVGRGAGCAVAGGGRGLGRSEVPFREFVFFARPPYQPRRTTANIEGTIRGCGEAPVPS